MVVDAQLESLRRIRDAKESAKSVKTDDAEVPVYMWNKRVGGCSVEQRDKALIGFWKFGLIMFVKGLRSDCTAHLIEQRVTRSRLARQAKEGAQKNDRAGP